jgi:hypothetical protein
VIPSDRARLDLLGALIASPEEVIASEFQRAVHAGVVSKGDDLTRLLAANDSHFYRGLRAIPGVDRMGLSAIWWRNTVAPMLSGAHHGEREL